MDKTLSAFIISLFLIICAGCETSTKDEPDDPNKDNQETVESQETTGPWQIKVERNWNHTCDVWNNMFPEKWQWIESNKANIKESKDYGLYRTCVWQFNIEKMKYSDVEKKAKTITDWTIGWLKPSSDGEGFWQYDAFIVSAYDLSTTKAYTFTTEVGDNDFPYKE